MATRFYLPSTGAAAVSPAFSAGWENSSIASRLRCVTTKIASAMTTVSFTDSDATNQDILFRQYVSDPIAQQVISSQTIEIQMRVKERDTSCNLFLAWNIKVVSNDGSVVRGTITNMERDATEASAVALVNRRETSTSTEVTAHSGDRIVIEVGMGGDPGAGSDHDSDMSVGDDSATDLAEDDTDTDADNPWVEFPNTLTFYTPGDIIVHEISQSVDAVVTTKTLSHTVSSNLSNRGLLVMAGAFNAVNSGGEREIDSVTYNGVALTKLVDLDGDPTMAVNAEWWFLANPATGTSNIVVTPHGEVDELNVHAVTLGNVDQSGQPDASNSDLDAADTVFDVDITTVTDRSFVFTLCTVNASGNVTPDAAQVTLGSVNEYWVSSYSGPKTPAGSVTHTYTNGATDDAITIGVAIKQFVATGFTPRVIMF